MTTKWSLQELADNVLIGRGLIGGRSDLKLLEYGEISMKKPLAALVLAGVLTLSVGSAVQAAPYPSPATATVSAATVTAGAAVVFSGTGFTPGESITITITFNGPTAAPAVGSGGGVSMAVPGVVPAAPETLKATAAADGSFSSTISLTQAGTYTLTATGDESGVSVSQIVKVVAPVAAAGQTSAGTGGLAETGVELDALLWSLAGVTAVAAGAGTVIVSRRRNRQAVAS